MRATGRVACAADNASANAYICETKKYLHNER